VVFDSALNGYRSLLLPLAWGLDLVRYALLASSANQLRFQFPKLKTVAINFQSKAVEQLSTFSVSETWSQTTREAVLATIILLIITDMMDGGNEFHLLLNMAKSWIEVMNQNKILGQPSKSSLDKFLLKQVDV
jgi:hypothetical protein